MKLWWTARVRLALFLRRIGWKIKPVTDHILYPGKFYKSRAGWTNPYTGKP